MKTTKTTAQLLSTLTTAEGKKLGNWCRKQGTKLAKLSGEDKQKAIRGWISQRIAKR